MSLNQRIAHNTIRNYIRKKAAASDRFDIKELLQNRNVRTGAAGLTAAAIAKLLGAGWGQSFLWGAGAAGLAHFGQKYYDKWDAKRKFDALSPEQRVAKLREVQQQLLAQSGAVTEKNKKQAELIRSRQSAEDNYRRTLEETRRIAAMSDAERVKHAELLKSIEDAELEEEELAESYVQGINDQIRREYREANKDKYAELAKINAKIGEYERASSPKTNWQWRDLIENPFYIRSLYNSIKGSGRKTDADTIQELRDRQQKLMEQLNRGVERQYL